MSTRKVSADQAYQVFKKNPKIKLTEEQVDAVENAAIDWPSLVVAGAGSGKTELMATRVVWLVANGLCEPQQILGLTFTRKAASELSRRINNALTDLAKSDLWPHKEKDFASPNITTYNSYANTLYRDYALALGYEDDATLLTDAGRFQLAREVVLKYGEEIDPRIVDADLSINQVVDGVLSLAGAMNDHAATSEEIEAVVRDLKDSIAALPAKAAVTPENPIGATLLKTISGMFDTPLLSNLAQAFIDEKRKRGYIDFSDQVALAERAVRELGDTVRLRETETYQQILLDEYQDTSTLQTRLLAGLYSGKSVFAVGDPNQSIYGWRGASASNLGDYLTTFGTTEREVRQFPLTTSWRNPKVVLDLANVILEPLSHQPSYLNSRLPLAKVDVRKLRAPAHAPEGEITVKFADVMENEAKTVAAWFKKNLQETYEGKAPTAAVLMRSRTHMPLFEQALIEAGIPVEVVGVGGILEAPEIVDLVAALRVIHLPSAGANLMRLLAGPRWQVEPKDLERLSRYSRNLAKFWTRESKKVSGPEAEPSIIDALDNLLDEAEDSDRLPDFSERGLAALQDCAQLLRKLRTQVGMPLPEFVRAVEQELWLDIELAANPKRVDPMANLNGFANLVTGYAEGSNSTLGGFLEWLEYADKFDKFETPAVAARPGLVQIITAHAAKGLEWDLVAVPTMVDGIFPYIKSAQGWLSRGELPYPLRGDANSLPHLDVKTCTNQTEVTKVVDAFKAAEREHLLREDRRVAYVALTRPKQKLLISGSKWKAGNSNAVKANDYIQSAARIDDPRIIVIDKTEDPINPLPNYPELDVNPIDETAIVQVWPMEPLGENHRKKVEEAKATVDAALADKAPSRIKIDETIDLLLAEAAELERRSEQVKLPVRIPASRFKEFIYDLPTVVGKYRRPMPEQPYKQTMAGTLFHSWVEQRFGLLGNSDELDAVELSKEDESTQKTVEELREIFEGSRFASMTPHSIESEIQVTIKGNTFICKLDAVFKTETGFEIVDWKTGRPPVALRPLK